jgi:hypothetical protein
MDYYFSRKKNIEFVVFNKYIIDKNGVIRNKRTGNIVTPNKNNDGYNICKVLDDDGNQRNIRVSRALASILGPPPTPAHSADHIDRNKDNDTLDNIRWATKKEQNKNQSRSETYKSAFVIIKDGVEKTANEWAEHYRSKGEYTSLMIKRYARKKNHGFSYKEYPDLPGEIWKEIIGSNTTQGRWEISNMNRVKYITKYAENVLSGERLGLINGYPTIVMGNCHILAFKTFFPEEYNSKKNNEIILHENDDRLDFRPHKLRLGTPSENGNDAHSNESYIGTKTERRKCASYINGIIEKEYDSYADAIRYLKSFGFDKAADTSIRRAINCDRTNGKPRAAYGRTWKIIDDK